MLADNQSNLVYVKAVPFVGSATASSEVIRSSANGLLHGIIIGSHSALFTFKLWNSATGMANPILGTFTPAAGSVQYNFSVPIEFTNGIFATYKPDGDLSANITYLIN